MKNSRTLTRSILFIIATVISIAFITHYPSSFAGNTIRYVNHAATGANNGTSWTNAYTSLQDALTAAPSGTQIWVAKGIYYPDVGTGQVNDAVASTFTLNDGVAIYGGFAGFETFLTERDWTANLTVLSGDLQQDDTTTNGVVTDPTDIAATPNAAHVVSSSYATLSAILDGFTITAGQAAGLNSPNQSGGGIYNEKSSPTLNNLTIIGNSASDNTATGYGGGMVNLHGSNPTLTNIIISNNAAPNGGGIDNFDGSNPTLTNVTLSGNSATFGGGMSNENSNPTLTNVTLSGNTASAGGGMSNDNSNPTLTNVTLSGNSASAAGGGLVNVTSNLTLTNVLRDAKKLNHSR